MDVKPGSSCDSRSWTVFNLVVISPPLFSVYSSPPLVDGLSLEAWLGHIGNAHLRNRKVCIFLDEFIHIWRDVNCPVRDMINAMQNFNDGFVGFIENASANHVVGSWIAHN